MSAEFELLDAWKAGDQGAGSKLLKGQFERLYRTFRGKVDAEEVGELIQQTLLRCVERRDGFRGDAQFSTYVFAVARSVLVDHYRKRERAHAFDASVNSVADVAGSPSKIMLEGERDRLLLRALRAIPLDHQLLLELRYWEHLTGPQLAEVLAVPEGTVRTRLRRAQELLRKAMAAACEDASLVDSTMDDLERWASALRDKMNG